MDRVEREAGETALAHLDHLLAQRPERVHDELTHAMRGIVRVRDRLIERLRSTNEPSPTLRKRLDRANILVSTAFGAQFPVTGVHWERIEKTRDGLKALMSED